MLVSELTVDCLEKYYTNGDLLDFFNVRDIKEIVESPQRAATAFFIRKDPINIEFVEKWLAIFDHFSLIDDTPSVSPNLDGFIENRHDQSVFSIMSKIRDVEIFPYSFICESVENPIWALRDKKIKLKYRYSFKRFCRKIKEWACERLK